jgi:hypothetical protein
MFHDSMETSLLEPELPHKRRIVRQSPPTIRLVGLGDFRDQAWTFHSGFSVGRTPSSEIILQETEGTSVSRRHASLWHNESGWWIADHDSTNGTFVNGNRINSKGVGPLQPRDIIQFGWAAIAVRSAFCVRFIEVEQAIGSPWNRFAATSAEGGMIQIGTPLQCGSLLIFPLFSDSTAHVDYDLSKDAMAAGFVTVSEISDVGSVPHLKVENRGTRRVLFLEGEELRGGKQNRILNGSALIPANSAIMVPVSCVEQGRWRHLDGRTVHGGTICSSRLRHALRSSVTRSLHHDLV